MVLNKTKCDAMLRSLAIPREDMADGGDSCGDAKKLLLGNLNTPKKDNEIHSILKEAAADSTSEAELKSVTIPLSNLSERMKQLREKAYKVIEKMSSLPNLSGDADDFKKEFELMQEMERINSELTNVNRLINVASQNSFKTNESTSLVDSQITLNDLLGSIGSNTEDWQTIKEKSVPTNPSKVPKSKEFSILRNDEEDPSSCTRVCEQILLDSQLKSSSQHVNLKKSRSKSKTTFPCKQNPFKSLIAKLSKSSLNNKKSTKAPKTSKFQGELLSNADIWKNSCNLKPSQRSSELNLTLSELLEDTCDVDCIIKENEFLQNQMMSFQQELESVRKEAQIYKSLLAKEQRKQKPNPVPNPKPKMQLSPNLLKIKNILDSSAALPAFPETIEVLKALCLLLLKKMNDAEDEEQGSVMSKANNESPNVLVVDSSTKLMLQNSMEILKAIKDITARQPKPEAEPKKKTTPKKTPSNGSQRKAKRSSSSAACSAIAEKPLTAPMEIDFQQFAEKLKQDQHNMKVFVQHIPKKQNGDLKTTMKDGKCPIAGLNGCDKIYLVFLK